MKIKCYECLKFSVCSYFCDAACLISNSLISYYVCPVCEHELNPTPERSSCKCPNCKIELQGNLSLKDWNRKFIIYLQKHYKKEHCL